MGHCSSSKTEALAPVEDRNAGRFRIAGIATEFVDATDETVYVGYETNEIDATNLFTEPRLVVQIALEHRAETEVRGAIFPTDRPVIGLWYVDEDWTEQYWNGTLSETALLARVLNTLSAVSFT